jgi:hypothetical protein
MAVARRRTLSTETGEPRRLYSSGYPADGGAFGNVTDQRPAFVKALDYLRKKYIDMAHPHIT